MRGLRHPNIVKFYGVTLDCEPVMVIMEHVKGGSLEQHLRNNVGTMTISDKVDIMVYGAAKGLEYLHASKVIHRDIAARNVLYNTESVSIHFYCYAVFCINAKKYTVVTVCHIQPHGYFRSNSLTLGCPEKVLCIS